MPNIIYLGTCNEMSHFTKPINHNKYAIILELRLGKLNTKSMEISIKGWEDTGKGKYKP